MYDLIAIGVLLGSQNVLHAVPSFCGLRSEGVVCDPLMISPRPLSGDSANA